MQQDLIYDVGMNHGEDTAHYLREGYRVVAIEANPVLAAENAKRFSDAIQMGRLNILPVGIGAAPGIFELWVNESNDEHSSFLREVGARSGSRAKAVPVECVLFADVLAKHGIPFYLKIDIERADIHCLRALTASTRPKYISVEAHELDYLCILHQLGYNAFKVVDQSAHGFPHRKTSNESLVARALARTRHFRQRVQRKFRQGSTGFPPRSSGPFGEKTPGEWQSLETVAYDWLHFKRGHKHRGTLNMNGWFDFHATLKE